jgi:hypothetical protein
MTNKRRKGIGALVLLLAVVLSGCGGGTASDTVSMYDLRVAMEAADGSLPDMTNLSTNDENAESLFSDYVTKNLDMEKVDSFFVSYATEGGKADEIVVIAVKNANDVSEAKTALEEHQESRRKMLEQYEPEQEKRVEDGVIFTKNQYAVLIICDNQDAVRKAFEEAIE